MFFGFGLLFGAYLFFCLLLSSPRGQQFVSCKEVSSYLQSLFGQPDLQLQISHRSENVLQEQRVTAENVSNPAAAADLL